MLRARDTDSLLPGLSWDRISVGWNFPHLFRQALGPTLPPVRWVLGYFHGAKSAEAWRWPLTLIYRRGKRKSRASTPLGLHDLF